ncbi:uncharacterized protein M6G45_016345 isoform 1-T1 [Spheniscus humboldti]
MLFLNGNKTSGIVKLLISIRVTCLITFFLFSCGGTRCTAKSDGGGEWSAVRRCDVTSKAGYIGTGGDLGKVVHKPQRGSPKRWRPDGRAAKVWKSRAHRDERSLLSFCPGI